MFLINEEACFDEFLLEENYGYCRVKLGIDESKLKTLILAENKLIDTAKDLLKKVGIDFNNENKIASVKAMISFMEKIISRIEKNKEAEVEIPDMDEDSVLKEQDKILSFISPDNKVEGKKDLEFLWKVLHKQKAIPLGKVSTENKELLVYYDKNSIVVGIDKDAKLVSIATKSGIKKELYWAKEQLRLLQAAKSKEP